MNTEQNAVHSPELRPVKPKSDFWLDRALVWTAQHARPERIILARVVVAADDAKFITAALARTTWTVIENPPAVGQGPITVTLSQKAKTNDLVEIETALRRSVLLALSEYHVSPIAIELDTRVPELPPLAAWRVETTDETRSLVNGLTVHVPSGTDAPGLAAQYFERRGMRVRTQTELKKAAWIAWVAFVALDSAISLSLIIAHNSAQPAEFWEVHHWSTWAQVVVAAHVVALIMSCVVMLGAWACAARRFPAAGNNVTGHRLRARDQRSANCTDPSG